MTEEQALYWAKAPEYVTGGSAAVPSETDFARAQRYGKAWVQAHLQLEALRDVAREIVQNQLDGGTLLPLLIERLQAELLKE